MNKYQQGKIYKLINNKMPNMVYYGSTYNTLEKRILTHNASSNICTSRVLYEYGNVEIILVENYPCNNRHELELREGYYIKNNECINRYIAGRSRKEYRDNNKEQSKEYREKIKEKSKEKFSCACGGKYTHQNKSRHYKRKKHLKYINS